MNSTRNRISRRAMPDTAVHPFAAAAMIFFASSACAITTIQSGTTEQSLSTDTRYVLPAGNTVQTSLGNAIAIYGIAPVIVDSAGTVISSTDNVATGYRFNVPGSLNQSASGSVLGHTYGVWMNGGGSGNDVVNRGDISARVSHAINYAGDTSGTIDNFGSLNGGMAGPISGSSEGVHISSTGTVVINNHAGASIVSGVGDPTYGVGILVEQGVVTVNNDGVIKGFHGGVQQTSTGTTTLVTSATGSVTGTQGPGVAILSGSANIANNGIISGTNFGIQGDANEALVVVNGATGSIRASEGPGIQVFSGNTLINNGVIEGANGPAVRLLGGNNTITLGTGSSLLSGVNLAVASQGSGNVITLTGNGTQAGNFNATPGSGFATLTSSPGSVWTLSGALPMGGASAATLAVAGDLTLGGQLAQEGGGGTTILPAGQLTLGAGGSSGMVSGDIDNNGTLRFNRSDAAVFAGVLRGPGGMQQNGSGSVTLSAAGSSQGSVAVNAGALRFLQNGAFTVTGDFAAAAGTATLIGGQSQLTVGNAFTMNGTLNQVIVDTQAPVTAASASIGPDANFNVAGYHASPAASATQLASGFFTEIHTSAPNGLSGRFANVRIGGSASSADYLIVTSAYTPTDYVIGLGLTWYASHGTSPQTANGAFTLIDAADFFDMDAILADQPANATTQWDGKTLTKAGAGTLQLSAANTYTGATRVNAGTLRAGASNVIASSAQLAVASGATFALNGFDQQANNLTGAGNVTLDGATLNANNSADTTFSGVISGNGGVTKTGANTLTLSGDNTFSGATTIGAGTLQLGAGGASGRVAGDIVDNDALVFNRSDTAVYANVISGTGRVAQSGSGTLVLSSTQTYSGPTSVDAGALVLANGAQLANTPQVTVAKGAAFGGYGGVGGSVTNNGLLAVADAAPGFAGGPAGRFTIGGALINNGAIRMSSPTPASALIVAGNYTGVNGQLLLSTALGGDNSATDKLVVQGNTAGQTAVSVANAGGAGAVTSRGIQIVQVDGASNGVFSLNGRAVAGPYEYKLMPDAGGWYLRSADGSVPTPPSPPSPPSPPNPPGPPNPPPPNPPPSPPPTPTPTPRPEPGGYLGNQAAARSMFVMTLHDRAGFPDPYAVNGLSGNESAAWVRTQANHADANAASGRISESADTAIVQAGIDLLRVSNGQRWQAGVMAGYGSTTTDATARNNTATARGNVNGASVGAYVTWHRHPFAPDGPYVDTWFQYAHFDNTVKGSFLNGESYASRYLAGSIEGGWAIPLARTSAGVVLVEPQLQLIYSNYGADDHIETNGTRVHSDTVNDLTTRLGVRLFQAPASDASPGWLPFAEVNWWHGTSGNDIAFNGFVVSQDGPRNRVEFKLGAQGQLAKQWRVWGNLGYVQGDGGYRSYEGLLGARYIW